MNPFTRAVLVYMLNRHTREELKETCQQWLAEEGGHRDRAEVEFAGQLYKDLEELISDPDPRDEPHEVLWRVFFEQGVERVHFRTVARQLLDRFAPYRKLPAAMHSLN